MVDGNNHSRGRSLLPNDTQPLVADNPQHRNQPPTPREPRTSQEPHTMHPSHKVVTEIIPRPRIQDHPQRQKAFRHRPNNIRPADVLGQDSGASNLAEYATEANRYDLPQWMVDDIHTLGPVNAQLKWKREKEKKRRAVEEGIILPPAHENASSDPSKGVLKGSRTFGDTSLKRKRTGDSKELPIDVDDESNNSSLVEVTRLDFEGGLKSAGAQPRVAPKNSLQEKHRRIGPPKPEAQSVNEGADSRRGIDHEAELQKLSSGVRAASSLGHAQDPSKDRVSKKSYSVSFPTARLMLIRVHETGELHRVTSIEQTRILNKIRPGFAASGGLGTRDFEDIAAYVVQRQSELLTIDREIPFTESAEAERDVAFGRDAAYEHGDVLELPADSIERASKKKDTIVSTHGVDEAVTDDLSNFSADRRRMLLNSADHEAANLSSTKELSFRSMGRGNRPERFPNSNCGPLGPRVKPNNKLLQQARTDSVEAENSRYIASVCRDDSQQGLPPPLRIKESCASGQGCDGSAVHVEDSSDYGFSEEGLKKMREAAATLEAAMQGHLEDGEVIEPPEAAEAHKQMAQSENNQDSHDTGHNAKTLRHGSHDDTEIGLTVKEISSVSPGQKLGIQSTGCIGDKSRVELTIAKQSATRHCSAESKRLPLGSIVNEQQRHPPTDTASRVVQQGTAKETQDVGQPSPTSCLQQSRREKATAADAPSSSRLPRLMLALQRERKEAERRASNNCFAAMTRMVSEDESDDTATDREQSPPQKKPLQTRKEAAYADTSEFYVKMSGDDGVGSESRVVLTSAKRKADREQPPPRKKAKEQEQVFKTPTQPCMSLAELAAHLAKESAQKARAVAAGSSERELFPGRRAHDTAAVPLTPGQRRIVLKYQQVNAEAVALSAAKSQEKGKSRASSPDKSATVAQEKPSPLTSPNAPPRIMPPPSTPVRTTSFIAATPQVTTLPPSSPIPTMSFTSLPYQFGVNPTTSPIVASAFVPQRFQVMLNQISSPFSVSGLLPSPLPIPSVSQDWTVDGLARDIHRHSSDVRNWMAGWRKTPIDLGFDHMVLLRDHEMLALRMSIEFERVDEVDARLMRMSDKLHEAAVALYDRTKMFLGETVEQQQRQIEAPYRLNNCRQEVEDWTRS